MYLARRKQEDERPGGSRSRRFVRALPVLMIICGVIFDLATPPRFTAVPILTAAPLIAAPFYPWIGTLLIGVAVTVTVFLLHYVNDITLRPQAVTELITVVTVSGLALLIGRVIRRGDERLASARTIAEAAQRAVVPTPAERIGGLRIAARYEAALADAFIGGDLFAVQDTPYGVRLVVGDVRGKGLGAVEAVAVAIGAFREAADRESALEGVTRRLESALVREARRRPPPDVFEAFTTAVLAQVSPGNGVVRLVNRGHPDPLLLHPDGRLDVLEPSEPALPLGMAELWPEPDRVDEYRLPRGATLLFYTDGLSEARDARGDFYDPVTRLAGRVFPGPGELLDGLIDDVRRHTGGGATDDMALLAVTSPHRSAGEGAEAAEAGEAREAREAREAGEASGVRGS
ncbi:PP2C family protein-serine/threonine phosphatase [Streptomyces sp. NPDC057638]|uniref:PP2C family protein-serine/threonine phosphatase n=1 Tax=Streptomyces sp. NPDC057638 TaxID=3346190 RepID=UPI0036885151